jgi:hypothetical protein
MWRLLTSTVAGALALAPLLPSTTMRAEPAPAVDPRSAPVARPARLDGQLAHLRENARPAGRGRLAIANGAYQASFAAEDGVVYLPRVGRGLDRARRWQYRARAIETDSARVALRPVAPVVSREGGHIVDFVRPGITERYVGRPHGVEQVFVLERRPAGDGDVRIRGDVSFAGPARQTAAGLEFLARGRAPFTYALPVAFDADRRPVAVRVVLEGSHVDLVLGARSLRGARFPVTIDPLFGAADAKPVWDYDAAASDVAYNSARDEFLAVFTSPIGEGSNSLQVYAKRYTSAGDPIGLLQNVTWGGYDVLHRPSVAYDQHLDRYLVVWSGYGNSWDGVRARVLDSTAVPLGNEMAIFNGGSPGAPDVEARNQQAHGLSDFAFLVAWAMPSGAGTTLWRTFVSGMGGMLSTTAIAAVEGDAADTAPAISFDPVADRFFVVWQESGPGASVNGWTIGPSGLAGAGIHVASTPGVTGQATVAFDPASARHLVVYSTPQGFAGRFVSGGQMPQPLGTSFLLPGTPPGAADRFKQVAAEPGAFTVAFAVAAGGVTTLRHQRWLATGLQAGTSAVDASGMFGDIPRMSLTIGQHGQVFGAHTRTSLLPGNAWVRVSRTGRWFAHAVHGQSGDFTGDGKSDLVVFRPSTGGVHIWSPTQTKSLGLATQAGIPVILDWDADGLADAGVFQPATGTWSIRLTGTRTVEYVTNLPGLPGDIPVPGDYFGDGADEVALFRPWTGTWYFRARIGPAGTIPGAVTASLGRAGDIPVPADWDGDGKREIGVFREGTGQGMWHLRELDGTPLPSVQWGSMGDIPLQGNFVGSAEADQVVHRRHEGAWYIRDGATGAGTIWSHNGTGVPMPLDYDGDGLLELVLFEEATGTWSIVKTTATSNVALTVTWGTPGDVPAGTR